MPFGSGSYVLSDLYRIDNIVKHVGIGAGRNLLIDVLRETFARSKDYHYVSDEFGFPKTPSHLDIDINAGINDNATTRLFIGSTYRYDISFMPAIVVRPTSLSYRPISMNQNKGQVRYEIQKVEDAYGEVTYVRSPQSYVFTGAWDQTFEVKVVSKSAEDTIRLSDLVLQSLQGTFRDELSQNGLFIKRVSSGGETTENINANDPLFSISISVDTFSEWRREIPISDVVDRIQLCFDFNISDNDPPATGLTFRKTITE